MPYLDTTDDNIDDPKENMQDDADPSDTSTGVEWTLGMFRQNAEGFQRKASEFLSTGPGFFAPYQSFGDLGLTLISPVGSVVFGTLMVGLLAAATPIAPIVSVFSFITAGVARAANKETTYDSAFTVAVLSGLIGLLAPFLAALFVILTVVGAASSSVKILTRTAATIVAPLCCSRESVNPDLEEEASGLSASFN